MGPWYGSVASRKGSELWTPIVKAVYNCVIAGLQDSEFGSIPGGP